MAFPRDMDLICGATKENLDGRYRPFAKLTFELTMATNASVSEIDARNERMHWKEYSSWLTSEASTDPGCNSTVKMLFLQRLPDDAVDGTPNLPTQWLCDLFDTTCLPKAGLIALKRLNMTFGTAPDVRSHRNHGVQAEKISRFYYAEPGWTMCWAHTGALRRSWAVFVCGSEAGLQVLVDSIQVECKDRPKDLHVPMFLAYISAKVSLAQMTPWLAERTAAVLEAEGKTGLLAYSSDMSSRRMLTTREYKTLSDSMSLSNGALIDMALRYRILRSFTDFVKRINENYCTPGSGLELAEIEKSKQITEMMSIMADHINVRLIKVESLKQRIDSQISLISNLIAQRDSTANIMIARASQAVARESRRDNMSMMTIAMVTMFFLPGTFVASFFAMPLFDWEAVSGATVMTHRFRYYWAVTGPLTFMVFVVWGIIFLWKRSRDSGEDQKEQQEIKEAFPTGDDGGSKPEAVVTVGVAAVGRPVERWTQPGM